MSWPVWLKLQLLPERHYAWDLLVRSAQLASISRSQTLSDQSLRKLGDADRRETRRCSSRADGSYPARSHAPHSACLSVPPAKHWQEFEAFSSMEGPKGEDRSAEQAASLFVAPELESQRRNSGRGKRRNNCKIITGVRFNKIPTYTSLSEHPQ